MGDFRFESDTASVWLKRIDAFLCVHLLERSTADRALRVLEIGVWKGGWASTILVNTPLARVTGVDPYPGEAEKVRGEMLARLETIGVAERFTLLERLDQLNDDIDFDLIHIDGDHSEASAMADIVTADALLAPLGVIVVDDISHKWLPGVASATYRYCGQSDLRMFLLTKQKGYFARSAHAAVLYRQLLNELRSHDEVNIHTSFQELTGHPYFESPDVLGQPVLLATRRAGSTGDARASFVRRSLKRVRRSLRRSR